MADKTLDAKGLNCPLPILRAKKSLKEVPAGGTLEVLATDPGSVADFAAFCRTTGNELLKIVVRWRRLSFRDQARRLIPRRKGFSPHGPPLARGGPFALARAFGVASGRISFVYARRLRGRGPPVAQSSNSTV